MSGLEHLTPDERQLYKEKKEQQLALMSPMEYGAYVSGMQRFDHVVYVDNLLMAAMSGRLYKSGVSERSIFLPDDQFPDDPEEGRWVHPHTGENAIFKIALSEPPRHGKSFHVSEHLPAWFVSNYRNLNVILASYEADFAASWGAKARDHIVDHPELGAFVRENAKSNKHWRVKGGTGEMKCAGAGGAITGMGWHLGIIDDLIKNSEEAMSEVVREGNLHWYLTTWKTRREPHPARLRMLFPESNYPDIFCVEVSMSTRWHQGDLNGWLRENEDTEWYFVNMPAVAFEDEQSQDYGDPGRCVLNRSPGDALCPARYNRTALNNLRTSGEGLFWFNALYQGVPRVEEGGIIAKPFHYFRISIGPSGHEEYILDNGDIVPVFKCFRFATVDLAATVKETSDYTVMAIWDVTPAPNRRLVLRAMFRRKMESADHESLISSWNQEFSPRYVGIEDRTFGTTLIQHLRRRGDVNVRPLPADTDKVTRALPFGYQVLSGSVFFPADAPWLEDFENELLDFPNGTHDDQVDVCAYAAIEFEKIPKRVRYENEAPTTIEEKVKAHVENRVRQKSRRRVRSKRKIFN